MAKSSTVTAARSWPMLTSICTCRAVVDLFPRRCLISCGSMVRMECTPAICPVIRRRTVVCECPINLRLRSITRSMSALPSRCSAGRREPADIFNTAGSSSSVVRHGHGSGNQSGHSTNRALRFTSRVRLIRKRTPPVRLGLTAAAQPFS